MELPNEYTSLVVILFCFVFIWDESVTSCVNQNTGEAFIHMTKISCLVTTKYQGRH